MEAEDFELDERPMFKLRPYQQECIDAIIAGWATYSRLLAVLATGCGKTVIFSMIALREVQAGGRVLILAHTDELLEQAIDKLQRATGLNADKEKADNHASPYAQVVVASIQTLSRNNRLTGFSDNHFSLVICDETHRALAKSYQKVLCYFHFGAESLMEGWKMPAPEVSYQHKARCLGVTATPDRADKRSLGEFYQKCVYDYGLLEACRDGYLVRPVVKQIPLKLDLRGVKKTAGDYDAGQIVERITPFLDIIAKTSAPYMHDRKSVVFTPSVETARVMADMLRKYGIDASHVSGQCVDRHEKIDAYHMKKNGSAICNAMLLTEGWDHDEASLVIVLRVTKIPSLFKQCLDEDTEILTVHGWEKNAEVGQLVASFDIHTEEIKYVPVLEVFRRPTQDGESFVSIKGPSRDIRVTDGHRMIFDNRRALGWKIKTAGELARNREPLKIPVSGVYKASGVPLSDDELRFIGWVMTDGCISKRTGGISISQGAHQPWIADIENCLKGCGFKYTKSERWRKTQFKQTSRAVSFTVSRGAPRGNMKHLRGWGALAPWLSKDFSSDLMELTAKQFDVLIEAIHLGDGCKQLGQSWTRRSYHIITGNLVFAERLQIVGVRSGYRSTLSLIKRDTRNYYAVRLKKQRYSMLGGIGKERPQWNIEPAQGESCWCVSNETGTLITRRNGCVAIVGNCVGRCTRTLTGIIDGLETREERLAAIAASEKKDMLILDYLWLTDKLDLVGPADLVTTNPVVKASIVKSGVEDLLAAEQEGQRDLLKSLEKAAKKHQHKQARTMDPIAWAVSLGDEVLAAYTPETEQEAKPATKGELDFLLSQNIDTSQIKSSGQAQKFIARIIDRDKLGLASPKQLQFLKQLGMDDETASLMSKRQAGAIIGQKTAHWKR